MKLKYNVNADFRIIPKHLIYLLVMYLALRNGNDRVVQLERKPCFTPRLEKLLEFGRRDVMFLLEHKISYFAWLTRLDCEAIVDRVSLAI